MASFKIGRTNQCDKCPWKVSTDPNTIPNDYSCNLHQNLAGTIAVPGSVLQIGKPMQVMTCHESPDAKPQHCVGWLHHQLGKGNNIPLRIKMSGCENLSAMNVVGKQHKTFKATLPK